MRSKESYGEFYGKKGRSGRKSLTDENIKVLVVKKSWGKLLKKLTKLDDKEIEKVCLPIALKNMPQNVNADFVGKIIVEISKEVANKNDITSEPEQNSD